MKQVERCREDRLNGAPGRVKLADTPTLFRETKNSELYIIVLATSFENRRYIPIGFLDVNVITTNAAVIISNASSFYIRCSSWDTWENNGIFC